MEHMVNFLKDKQSYFTVNYFENMIFNTDSKIQEVYAKN